MTFKSWTLECECGWKGTRLVWDYDLADQTCSFCNEPVHLEDNRVGDAPGVIGDELHGYEARHGVCNPDGSPRTFYSKTDLKRALNEKGLKIDGDTPGKPYKV